MANISKKQIKSQSKSLKAEYGIEMEEANGHFYAYKGEDEDATLLAEGDDFEQVAADAVDKLNNPETDDEETEEPEGDEPKGDTGEPTEDETDEEKVSHSVVPDKFRLRYKEAGHPAHCGDWLAETLNEHCVNAEGDFDVECIVAIAELNGIKTDKYSRSSKGWQGRLRMTLRNLLAPRVAKAGVMLVPIGDGETKEETVPDYFKAKHVKVKQVA